MVDGASCLIEGNSIGTDNAGSNAVANVASGIFVSGGKSAGTSVTIGGTTAGAGNLVSGNAGNGIEIEATSGLVQGNTVGTDKAGAKALANSLSGIDVVGTGATIGGTATGAGNLVSGNTSNGIDINAASCLVQGNTVGTDKSGAVAIANLLDGILVSATSATIGGAAVGAGNLVSGNFQYGITITGDAATVQGNLIGTDKSGEIAIGNRYSGILVAGTNATIGGTSAGAGNLVSGNTSHGIFINSAATLVEGNYVGTDKAGTKAIANNRYGIYINASGVTIGGTAAGAGNLVSGNNYFGIGPNGRFSSIQGNLIGTDATGSAPIPNISGGVVLFGMGNTIGGATGAGNVIAFNGGPGVATSGGAAANPVRFNAIFGNTGSGIDLNNDGVTPNTPGRANNTPVIASTTGGTITGTINAARNAVYTLDFYASDPSDASPSRPQGRRPIGSTTVLTDATGDAVFNVAYTPVPGRPIVTATSTDASGTTSEFSTPFGLTLTASGVTFNATAGTPFNGTVANFASSDSTATAANFTASINWGDGTPATAGNVVAGPGGFVVVGSHTFTAANPDEPVTVTITDTRFGITTTANSLAVVAPAAVIPPAPAPVLTPLGKAVPFIAGASFGRVVASFADSDPRAFAGQFSATINWGDGSPATIGIVTAGGTGFDVTGTHTYNLSGNFPIVVTVHDGITNATLAINSTAAVDVVPIIIQPKAFAVTGKKNFSGALATFVDGDPRIDPTFYTANIDWGDGSPTSAGTIMGSNPFTVSGSHTFPSFQNTHLVTITVTDKNGRSASTVDRVVDPPALPDSTPTPTPVPPVSLGSIALQAGGLTLSRSAPIRGVVASFGDTGPALLSSAYHATIRWGRGRHETGMVVGANGRFVVSATSSLRGLVSGGAVAITIVDNTGRVAFASETASYPVIIHHPHPKPSRHGR